MRVGVGVRVFCTGVGVVMITRVLVGEIVVGVQVGGITRTEVRVLVVGGSVETSVGKTGAGIEVVNLEE